MINCIAIDDEPMALGIIKMLCERIPDLNLAQTFTQVSLAENYVQSYPVDLIFLDVQMPDKNGISLAKQLPQDIMIIFTTAFSQYAVDGFNLNAVDYLLKPIEFERFEIACKRAIDYYNYSKSSDQAGNDSLYVRSEYALVKIPFDQISYFETMDDYIKIHQTDGKVVLTLMSMKNMMKKLPASEFVRIHRSYAVSLAKIESIRGKTLSIGDKKLPLGSSYQEDFMMNYQG
ncbi:MAG: DNA-binding LytR/AlgR family response regulator [Crocinitomicaceae bacterium]|jgi:DNA-binding LytR/AlgR family response regulator